MPVGTKVSNAGPRFTMRLLVKIKYRTVVIKIILAAVTATRSAVKIYAFKSTTKLSDLLK
jgi:hypothetical protein